MLRALLKYSTSVSVINLVPHHMTYCSNGYCAYIASMFLRRDGFICYLDLHSQKGKCVTVMYVLVQYATMAMLLRMLYYLATKEALQREFDMLVWVNAKTFPRKFPEHATTYQQHTVHNVQVYSHMGCSLQSRNICSQRGAEALMKIVP